MTVKMIQTPDCPDCLLTNIHRREMHLMDIIFEISVVTDDEVWAIERTSNAFAEIYRIERLLTEGHEYSPASLINKNAGLQPVKVDSEVFNLIDRALKISELTQGDFDITYRKTAGNAEGKSAGYRNIILDFTNTTVFLQDKNMQIDLGSIAKGYVIDSVKYLMQMQGVSSGVINASGYLVTWGRQPNAEPWTIETAAPNLHPIPLSNLNISNMAVVTSVSTQNADDADFGTTKKVTGANATGIKSVSILSTSAMLAHALAAPVMAKGVKVSLRLFNQLNQVACIITNRRKKIYTSKNIA